MRASPKLRWRKSKNLNQREQSNKVQWNEMEIELILLLSGYKFVQILKPNASCKDRHAIPPRIHTSIGGQIAYQFFDDMPNSFRYVSFIFQETLALFFQGHIWQILWFGNGHWKFSFPCWLLLCCFPLGRWITIHLLIDLQLFCFLLAIGFNCFRPVHGDMRGWVHTWSLLCTIIHFILPGVIVGNDTTTHLGR
jgi:hypothetical protein